jgi:hypothetical protein
LEGGGEIALQVTVGRGEEKKKVKRGKANNLGSAIRTNIPTTPCPWCTPAICVPIWTLSDASGSLKAVPALRRGGAPTLSCYLASSIFLVIHVPDHCPALIDEAIDRLEQFRKRKFVQADLRHLYF